MIDEHKRERIFRLSNNIGSEFTAIQSNLDNLEREMGKFKRYHAESVNMSTEAIDEEMKEAVDHINQGLDIIGGILDDIDDILEE